METLEPYYIVSVDDRLIGGLLRTITLKADHGTLRSLRYSQRKARPLGVTVAWHYVSTQRKPLKPLVWRRVNTIVLINIVLIISIGLLLVHR